MPLPALAPRLPGNSQPAVEKLSTKEHTEAEWESKRELINKLYIGESRKLSEIIAILESRHGFAATEQMYKKRLRKWNIRKRSYRKSQTPTSASTPSPSPFRVEKQESSFDSDAESSYNAADVDLDLKSDVEEVPRTPGVSCHALDLIRPSRLEAYAGLESVLESVYTWSNGKLETHDSLSDPMSKYLAAPNQPPIQDSRTMYRTFELVFDLWSRGRGNLAGMAARKGFYVLEYVLTDDHPDLVWHMLDTVYDMVNTGHLQLLGMFLNHALVLARAKLPAQHPLLQILWQLKKCDYQTETGRQYICYLLRQAWLRNVDVLGEQIGSTAPKHLWLYEQLIWDGRSKLRKHSDLKRRMEAMNNALNALGEGQLQDGSCSSSDRRRVEALMLEFTQMDLKDVGKAEELAMQLLQNTEDPANVDPYNARFQAYALKMLARIHEGRNDWDVVEKNLNRAIEMREAAHGASNNIRVVRDMWVLSRHYARVGRQEDADRVVEDAINRAAQYLEDLPG